MDAGNVLFGRGAGYRNMDASNNDTSTGSSAGPNFENGLLDNAGPGAPPTGSTQLTPASAAGGTAPRPTTVGRQRRRSRRAMA
ncbi:MAG: hypothetical protein K2Q09_05040 [Phycisphaerales bacterium]|nr:hypothetical protein [Phycisphaerales bacterium]